MLIVIRKLQEDLSRVWLVEPKLVPIRTLKQEAEARMVQRNNSFRNRIKR